MDSSLDHSLSYVEQLIGNIKQTIALTIINFKSFPQRFTASLVSIVSTGCVAAVMLSVLAMTEGMMKTLQGTGLDNTLLVMRAGAVSELQSVMFPAEMNILANNDKISRDEQGQAHVSAEMFVNAEVSFNDLQGIQVSKSLALRGINASTMLFRPNFTLVSGKLFTTGIRQLLIGQAIASRMPALSVGKTITLGGAQWQISGIFSDKNSVFESELWADIGIVQSDYQRGNTIQSVRLALNNINDLALLKKEWQDDPRLNIRVLTEKKFFADQAKSLTRLIRWLGFPVAFVMALGAMVAALNTMYAAIASRSKEIAIHKAIGFSPFAISMSILCEAVLIALVGGVLGILPLYLVFDGWTAATQNASSLSQMMFNFDITLSLIAQAMALALLIGLLGGLLPAFKAMRLPVTEALRD
ncbi:MAG: putative ABC transport system permease protein [Cognaticolwellia sp.]|jgi:putative ABC transport system permease protein